MKSRSVDTCLAMEVPRFKQYGVGLLRVGVSVLEAPVVVVSRLKDSDISVSGLEGTI